MNPKTTLADLPPGAISKTFEGSAKQMMAETRQPQQPKRDDYDLWVSQQKLQRDI